MLVCETLKKTPKDLLALTGMVRREFAKLLPVFCKALAGLQHRLHKEVWDLPAEAMDWLPGPEMNSVAVLLAHMALVVISGLAEIGLGAALLALGRWSTLAAWGLIALLIAVFPANVHMALHPWLYPWGPWRRCGYGCRCRGC